MASHPIALPPAHQHSIPTSLDPSCLQAFALAVPSSWMAETEVQPAVLSSRDPDSIPSAGGQSSLSGLPCPSHSPLGTFVPGQGLCSLSGSLTYLFMAREGAVHPSVPGTGLGGHRPSACSMVTPGESPEVDKQRPRCPALLNGEFADLIYTRAFIRISISAFAQELRRASHIRPVFPPGTCPSTRGCHHLTVPISRLPLLCLA